MSAYDGDFDEFCNRAATIMAADRPDLWDHAGAANTLRRWEEMIVASGQDIYSVASGSFKLERVEDEDGYVEWSLTRNVIDFWEDETQPGGYDWDLKTN